MGNQNPQIEEGQTTQWSNEEGQTTQWSNEEGQTTQWSNEKGQTTIYKALQIKLASLAFLLEATLYQGTRSLEYWIN
jgi:hypothetical protein